MTLDDCDRVFAGVRRGQSLSEVHDALEVLFADYPLIEVALASSMDFWRARKTGERSWPHEEDLWHPPAEKANFPGRLNDPGSPCLYGSTRIETAMHEVSVQDGDHVQLAAFRVKGSLLRAAVIGELMHVYKTGYLRLTGIDPVGSCVRLLNSRPEEESRRILYIDAFLAELLCDETAKDSQYLHSRALASFLHRNRQTDAIVFPSVRDDLGMNIAIGADPATRKLRMVCCFHARIRKVRSYGFIEYEVLNEAARVLDGSRFDWTQPTVGRRTYFNLSREESQAASC